MVLGAVLLNRCLDGAHDGDVDAGEAAAYVLELGRISH